MKKFFLPLLVALPAAAQVYTPPTQPSQTAQPAGPAGDTVVRPANQPAASPMGEEIPFVDPSAETVKFNGQTFAITDNRLFQARFQKFLNEPEDNTEVSKQYRAQIRKILDAVGPMRRDVSARQKLLDGVALLPKAAEFDSDANLCESLLHMVYTAMLANRNIDGLRVANQAIEEELKQVRWNTEVEEGKNENFGKSGATTKGSAPQRPNVASSKMLALQKKNIEKEAEIKKNKVAAEVAIVRAKIEYQSLIVQFFIQRRFEHVIMACRFYPLVFGDGEAKLRLEKGSDVEKLFTQSVGMPPTVSSLDLAANNALRDTKTAIDAFNYMVESKNLDSATKRLSEAFAIGEYTSELRTLPRDRKQKIQDYARQSYKLLNAIQVKDYAQARKIIDDLKSIASDFDATKPETAIATYTRISDMHLLNARQALMIGDQAKSQEEIKKAMEVWPLNPKINEFDSALVQSTDLFKFREEFKQLLNQENYRAIFKDQYRFAPVIKGDATLEDAFRQIITNITEIEKAIAKAREFEKMGNPYGAWEDLRKLREDKTFSRDPELGRMIEQLSPRVAELSVPLDKAQQSEQLGETGSALSWYLKAKQVYPNSSYARDAINRLLGNSGPSTSSSLSAPPQPEVLPPSTPLGGN